MYRTCTNVMLIYVFSRAGARCRYREFWQGLASTCSVEPASYSGFLWVCIGIEVEFPLDENQSISFTTRHSKGVVDYMHYYSVCKCLILLVTWLLPCFSPDKMGLLDPSTSDGRIIFFLPWQKHTLAGKEEDLIHINQPFTLVIFFFFKFFGILTLGMLVIVSFFSPRDNWLSLWSDGLPRPHREGNPVHP